MKLYFIALSNFIGVLLRAQTAKISNLPQNY